MRNRKEWLFTLLLLAITPTLFAQTDIDRLEPYHPALMDSRITLDLDTYYFVAENKFYSFKPGFVYGLPGKRHAMGIALPVVHSIFSGDFAGFENTTGIGDMKFFYHGVAYQAKDPLGLQRITATFEATAPTGNARLGRGTGAWVYKPGVVVAIRPDEAFYLFPTLNFQISSARLNSLGGADGVPDLANPDLDDQLKVMSMSLPATFVLDSWSGWVSLHPEYIHTFVEDTYFLFLRLDLGKMIGSNTSASLQITKFIAGQPRLETWIKFRLNFFLGQRK
ncbi:MAG: hypothetical protein KF845_11395 [Cyclobacteriaceae bacterium]|nr:hypothetical protein [Cyclobacteriaceae bacterium]